MPPKQTPHSNEQPYNTPTNQIQPHPSPSFPPTTMHLHDGSFIPPTKNSEGQIEGNTNGSGVYSPNNNTQLLERLPCYRNILRAELNMVFIAIKTIQTTQLDMHIFKNNLHNIFLIDNHIKHPTSQHQHPNKLLTTIVHHTY